MWKFGRRSGTKGKSIENPFGIELPSQLPPVELEYLVELLRLGLAEKGDIEDIFMSHVRLGMSIASSYAYRNPTLAQDLVSVAVLAIAETISRAPEILRDNQITPYITTNIRGQLSDFVGNQYLVPASTYRKIRAKGDNKLMPLYEPLTKANERAIDLGTQITEIMELIEFCINQDDNLKRREYKRVVIGLKAAGYNNTEVAKMIDVSINYVQLLISQIKYHFEKEHPLSVTQWTKKKKRGCGLPCSADTPCAYCEEWWQTMVDQGYWKPEIGWSENGIQEFAKV